jgi:hypothetical protein
MILTYEAEARLIIFKNSVRTAKKTQHFTITKINWLTLFKEIIAVYSENHTNSTHRLYSADKMQITVLIVEVRGVYSYH